MCQIKKVRKVGDNGHFVFRQKLLDENGSVMTVVVMVKQQGLFSPKFGATSSHVFTQDKPGIHSALSVLSLVSCFSAS
jgi:hypothetical protein